MMATGFMYRRGNYSSGEDFVPEYGGEPIQLAPEPSWDRVAYVRR